MRIIINSNRTWTIPITIDSDNPDKFVQDFSLNVDGNLISQLTGKLTGASKDFLEVTYISNRIDTCVELWQRN